MSTYRLWLQNVQLLNQRLYLTTFSHFQNQFLTRIEWIIIFWTNLEREKKWIWLLFQLSFVSIWIVVGIGLAGASSWIQECWFRCCWEKSGVEPYLLINRNLFLFSPFRIQIWLCVIFFVWPLTGIVPSETVLRAVTVVKYYFIKNHFFLLWIRSW